jgi:hypothetical protein
MSIETIVDDLEDRFNRTADDLAAMPKKCLIKLEDAVHGYFVRRWIAEKTEGGMPLFEDLAIETINYCNGTCAFCPINRDANQRPRVVMPLHLFDKIILQLQKLRFQGTVSMCGNNEPLLDVRIFDWCAQVKHTVPGAKVVMVTNGTILTATNICKLMEHVDHLTIDNYRGEEGREHIDTLNVFRFGHSIAVNHIPANAVRTARAGQAPNKRAIAGLKSPCDLPFRSMLIRGDGGVSQCCADALGVSTMGNAYDQSLVDIWNGQKLQQVRKQLLGSRQYNQLCRECDVFNCFPAWLRVIKRAVVGRRI